MDIVLVTSIEKLLLWFSVKLCVILKWSCNPEGKQSRPNLKPLSYPILSIIRRKYVNTDRSEIRTLGYPIDLFISSASKNEMTPGLACTIPLNTSRPNPGRRKKINLYFYFLTSLRASKGFITALKQGSAKKKMTLIFTLIQLSEIMGWERTQLTARLPGSITIFKTLVNPNIEFELTYRLPQDNDAGPISNVSCRMRIIFHWILILELFSLKVHTVCRCLKPL